MVARLAEAADLQTHQKPFLRVSPKPPCRKGFRQFRQAKVSPLAQHTEQTFIDQAPFEHLVPGVTLAFMATHL